MADTRGELQQTLHRIHQLVATAFDGLVQTDAHAAEVTVALERGGTVEQLLRLPSGLLKAEGGLQRAADDLLPQAIHHADPDRVGLLYATTITDENATEVLLAGCTPEQREVIQAGRSWLVSVAMHPAATAAALAPFTDDPAQPLGDWIGGDWALAFVAQHPLVQSITTHLPLTPARCGAMH